MARKNHVRYPAMPRAEDSEFRDRMIRCVEWRVWDNPPEMYVRLIHGANTWEEGHFRPPPRTNDSAVLKMGLRF